MIKLFNRDPKPVAEGYLPEEDGHKVYWARYGNVNGETIIDFHGGPGLHSKPYHAKCFNLKKYNVIHFDQRGCGKSEPLGKLENNNLSKIVSDVKRILDILQVKNTHVKGGSWGSLAGLYFCEKYPKLIDKIIVSDIFLGRKEDDEWTYEHMRNVYPDFYENMIKDKPKNKSLANYYYDLAISSKIKDKRKMFNGLMAYESVVAGFPAETVKEISENKLKKSKIYLNYFKNNWFLKDNELLKNIKSISNKPCLIIHNRLDLICPIIGAYDLHKVMKKSKLKVFDCLGHNVFRDSNMKKIKILIAEFLEK